MRKNIHCIISAIVLAFLLSANLAVCEEKKPAQPAERKPLIFRLIDMAKNLPFIKKAPAAPSIPAKMPAKAVPVAPAPSAKIEEKKLTPPEAREHDAETKVPSALPADEKLPPEAKKAAEELAKSKPRKALTKEELLTDIKETLDSEEEILGYIPDLKKIELEAGKISYTYKGTPLEDLDKDKLEKINVRVNQTFTHITTQRVQEQLEQIRQIENLRRIQNVPTAPPYIPPSVPQMPPQPPPQAATQPPPTPPRIPPSPPPQPPETRR